MADKRMFSKKMINSDAFLEMPLTAQGLYFHLAMRADDDGIVDSPKKIIRECQAKKKDLDILIEKRYVLSFPSGVILIKHWKIHNTIPKDRYTPSTYTEELSTVYVKDNKSYTERKQADDTLADQIREDKKREEQNRKEDFVSHLFDAEKAWEDTFAIYPKKTCSAVAKTVWMDKLLLVLEDNRKDVAILIGNATKMYLKDYKERNPDDDSFRYVPKYCDWLKNDCDYWIGQYEKSQKAVNDDVGS